MTVSVPMARPPTQQHRALAAIARGLIVRVVTDLSPNGSWQWWTGERWRTATGTEHNALKALMESDPPLIEVSEVQYGGIRETFRVTAYGEVMQEVWTRWMGPVVLDHVPVPEGL